VTRYTRAHGGGPAAVTVAELLRMLSPCARGWTAFHNCVPSCLPVVPVRTGVDLTMTVPQ